MNSTLTTKFQAVMKQIWPYIYSGINSALYFLLNLIRETIKIAINSIKG